MRQQQDRAGAHVEPLKAPGTPIGTFPDCAYPNRQIAFNNFNRLFVFSDGAYEILRPDGSMLSLEEFTNHLLDRTRSGTSGPDATLAFLEKMRGSASYEDDLALVEIGFPAT